MAMVESDLLVKIPNAPSTFELQHERCCEDCHDAQLTASVEHSVSMHSLLMFDHKIRSLNLLNRAIALFAEIKSKL